MLGTLDTLAILFIFTTIVIIIIILVYFFKCCSSFINFYIIFNFVDHIVQFNVCKTHLFDYG